MLVWRGRVYGQGCVTVNHTACPAQMHAVDAVMSALQRELKWLRKQRDRTPRWRDTCRRGDLIASCVAILRQSIRDYNPWVQRKPDRKRRIRDVTRWTSPASIQAVAELVELTLSDIGASRAFMPFRAFGSLQIRRVRRVPSDAQSAALQAGRDRANRANVFRVTSALTNTRGAGQRRTNGADPYDATLDSKTG